MTLSGKDIELIASLAVLLSIVLLKRSYPEPFRLFSLLPFNGTFLRLYNPKLRSWRSTILVLLAVSIVGAALSLPKLEVYDRLIRIKLSYPIVFLSLYIVVKRAVRYNSGRYLFKQKKASRLISNVLLVYLAYQGFVTFWFWWLIEAAIVPLALVENAYLISLLILQILGYVVVIKKLQQMNIRVGLPFILYLCALEIAPVIYILRSGF